MQIIQEFKKFLLRGNVVDLGIAVVIGAAFSAIVNSFVKDLLTPLIAALGGNPDFSNLKFTINNSQFLYGDFLNALISFLIVSSVIFFLIITPMNALVSRTHKEKKPADPTTKKCPECFSEINIKATRCAFCTAEIGDKSAAK